MHPYLKHQQITKKSKAVYLLAYLFDIDIDTKCLR